MDKHMNTGIKEVISKFPQVGKVLEEYGIGCVSCTAGSCLLRDVVEIHNLGPQAEAEMMSRIAGLIDPDGQTEVAVPAASHAKEPRQIRYSPPMQKLVREHELIKRWLAMVPEIVGRLDSEWERFGPVLVQAVAFIRSYADAYHHAKEEDVLFAGLDDDLDIIKVMRQDHEQARALVRRLAEAVETADIAVVADCLNQHRELLQEHIKKEDEILYPWIDRGLSDTQVGHLFSRFGQIDRQFGDHPAEQEQFIRRTERMLEESKSPAVA